MCQHYVSDLVWAVLKTNLVPVVFGKKIDKAHKILKKKTSSSYENTYHGFEIVMQKSN